MFNFACKDTNNSQTTNYFWEFLYSLKWIFDYLSHRAWHRVTTEKVENFWKYKNLYLSLQQK